MQPISPEQSRWIKWLYMPEECIFYIGVNCPLKCELITQSHSYMIICLWWAIRIHDTSCVFCALGHQSHVQYMICSNVTSFCSNVLYPHGGGVCVLFWRHGHLQRHNLTHWKEASGLMCLLASGFRQANLCLQQKTSSIKTPSYRTAYYSDSYRPRLTWIHRSAKKE